MIREFKVRIMRIVQDLRKLNKAQSLKTNSTIWAAFLLKILALFTQMIRAEHPYWRHCLCYVRVKNPDCTFLHLHQRCYSGERYRHMCMNRYTFNIFLLYSIYILYTHTSICMYMWSSNKQFYQYIFLWKQMPAGDNGILFLA